MITYNTVPSVDLNRSLFEGYPICQSVQKNNREYPPLVPLPDLKMWRQRNVSNPVYNRTRFYANGVQFVIPSNITDGEIDETELNRVVSQYGLYFQNPTNGMSKNENGTSFYDKLSFIKKRDINTLKGQAPNSQFINYTHGFQLRDRDYQYRRARDHFFIQSFTNDQLSEGLNKRIEGLNDCSKTHSNPELKEWFAREYLDEKRIQENIQREMDSANVVRKKELLIAKIRDLCREHRMNPHYKTYIQKILNCGLQIRSMIHHVLPESLKENFYQYFEMNNPNRPEPSIIEVFDFLVRNQININANINLKKNIELIFNESNQFNMLIEEYILPQNMHVGLYGFGDYLTQVKLNCEHLLNISPFISNIESKPCHPYIQWTLMANTLRTFCILKKNCDIPLVFWMKFDINYKFNPRIYYELPLNKNNTKSKFIGILRIPFYTTNVNGSIDFHYFHLFLFQYNHKIIENRIYRHYSNILILNKERKRIELGSLFENPLITYDELKILYYLSNLRSNLKDQRCYLYHDPRIPKMIMVSLKDNLINKYPHLRRVIMEITETSNHKKKLIIRNSENEANVKFIIDY